MEKRTTALDNLRTFITLLVVGHHAAIAYSPYAYFDAAHYLWGAPIVDTARWQGFDLFVHFNDVFFMPLMFFISGLFVWPSINHRGGRAFLRERLKRLGVPFIAAIVFLMPLAFYPSFRMTGANVDFTRFWMHIFSVDAWPVGPAWFMWVLLAMNITLLAAATLGPRAE
jgi:glucans biosynthesis protein C